MPCRRVAWAVLWVVFCGCQRAESVRLAAPKATACCTEPEFVAQPPEPPGSPLPLLRLGVSKPREAFLRYLPAQVAAKASSAEDGFEFQPSFAELADMQSVSPMSSAALVKATVSRMHEAFKDELTFPDQARILHYARAIRGQNGGEDTYEPAQTKLLYVSLRRKVGDYITDGPGSRFTTAVAADGSIRGAVYYWRERESAGSTVPALDPQIVRAKITNQIQQVSAKYADLPAHAIVRQIRFAYYDGDQKYLQPVYRFLVEIKPAVPAVSKGRTAFYVGYVPLDDKLGEVPTSLVEHTAEPSPVTSVPSDADPIVLPTGPEISVGRYIARGANDGFIRDSEAFWQELNIRGGPFKFADTQNYLARRFMFTSRKDHFVNLVDLALVEAHGTPWTIITYRDFAGDVKLNGDVPLSGYGTGSGGRLKHLVLHSCRVIPTGIDSYYGKTVKAWAGEWWGLFNGLSSVVGYRSSMFISDGAGRALARNLARGEAVVPAWFGAVASLNIYGPNSWENTYCAKGERMGRAAAIAVCGEGSSARVKDASTPKPLCLEAWWMGDELVPLHGAEPEPKMEMPLDGMCPDEGDLEGGFPCCKT